MMSILIWNTNLAIKAAFNLTTSKQDQ
jgi:hypothetical protein